MMPETQEIGQALTMITLVLGVPFMLLSLNGPIRVLRWRRKGLPAEGTICDTEEAPLNNFVDRPGSRGAGKWHGGAFCAVYSYTLPDGRPLKSAIKDRSQWTARKEDIVIGTKVPLFYMPDEPLKIARADQPMFDGGDGFFFTVSFLMIAPALNFWPLTTLATVVLINLYVLARCGALSKDETR